MIVDTELLGDLELVRHRVERLRHALENISPYDDDDHTVESEHYAEIGARLRAHEAEMYYLELLERLDDPDAENAEALRLRAMPYEEFLQTRYWDTVRSYVWLIRGRICGRCVQRWDLQVHHESYEHHGREHRHLDDLIVLCRRCHERTHGI